MAAVNHVGLKVNVENYWAKGMWPTNSPDFSPFENVRAILQEKADKNSIGFSKKNLRILLQSISKCKHPIAAKPLKASGEAASVYIYIYIFIYI